MFDAILMKMLINGELENLTKRFRVFLEDLIDKNGKEMFDKK